MNAKLLPFILIMAAACNDDHTRDNLRHEIELKDRQKQTLQSEVIASKTAEEDARAALQKTIEDNALKVQSLEENIALLEQSVAEKSEVLATIEGRIAEKTVTIETLEKNIQKSEEERKALATELDAERSQATSDKTALEKDLADKLASLAEARSSLDGANAREAELKKNVEALNLDIKAKADAIVKLDEQIKAITPAGAVPEINEMINKLEDTKKELAALQEAKAAADIAVATLKEVKEKSDLELARNSALFTNTMSPLWGMYYSRRSTLSFGDVKCHEYVYVQPKGDTIAAVVCEDGRMQWEKRGVKSFAAINDAVLDGRLGFQMKADLLDSSCKANETVFKTDLSYTFDRGSRLGASELATSMSVKLNDKATVLDTASLDFTSSECEDLEAMASNGSVTSPELKSVLNGALRVCSLAASTEADPTTNIGCFGKDNQFVK